MSDRTAIHDTAYYRRLTRTLVTVMLLASLTPLLLISAITGYRYHTAYTAKVIDHLQEMVEKHKQNIDSFLTEKLANIRFLGETCLAGGVTSEVLQQGLIDLQKEYGRFFVDLGLVDEHGMLTSYAGPLKLGNVDYSDARWFKEAMTRNLFISDVFLGLRGTPHFIVAIRRTVKGEERILRATIDFESFNHLVESVRIGRTGMAYILNREGKFQTSPRIDPVQDHAFFQGLATDTDGSARVHIFKRTLPGNVQVIVLTSAMKNGSWILAYQQDWRDAFSELYQARNLSLFILVVGTIGITFMALFLSRKMVVQIRKADRDKEMMNDKMIEAGRLASLGELAAGIAHEINNPVAIMVEEAGWMGDLLEDGALGDSPDFEEFVRSLQQIRLQGDRCKEITLKLLSFARKIDSRSRDVDINKLIEEVIGLSKKHAGFGNVRISTNLDPDLPPMILSPSEMQQVILNLVNNGVDAIDSRQGGEITVTTRTEKDRVIIEVTDNGRGIPAAELPRIFDPFFTTKPVGKGTGLGLSICYGIIRKMNGEISVQSTVGAGTTFRITLPEGGQSAEPSASGR